MDCSHGLLILIVILSVAVLPAGSVAVVVRVSVINKTKVIIVVCFSEVVLCISTIIVV